jgi:PKD domain-containing protein
MHRLPIAIVLLAAACGPTPEESVTEGSAAAAVTVASGPVARIVRDGGAATGPAPFYIQLDGTTSSCPGSWCARFDWDFGDGSRHATTSWVAHTYRANGTYAVTLKVKDGAGRVGTATLSIVVAPAPTPNAVIVRSGAETGPAPFEVHLDATTSTCPGSSCAAFDWDFGDGSPHAAAAVVAHTYQREGTYTATLSVTNGAGTVGTATLATVVTPPPPPCGDYYQGCCTAGPACLGSYVCVNMGGPSGTCIQPAAPGNPCDDHDPCTVELVSTFYQSCTWINVMGPCRSDTCVLNGVTTVCDDGNPCTRDLCDPNTHCWSVPDVLASSPCDDGNACTVGDTCSHGACTGQPSPDPVCRAACVPTAPVENCYTPEDDDCNGFTNEADPMCFTCFWDPCPAGMGCDSGGFCYDVCTDGQKGGLEGDVDCGGTCAVRCKAGQSCNVDSDCESRKCVLPDPSVMLPGVCSA